MRYLWLRLLIIVVVIGLAIWKLYPPQKNINLGLDLQGGTHLVIKVDVDKAVENELIRLKNDIERYLIKRKVFPKDITVGKTDLTITFDELEDRNEAFKLLKDEYEDYKPTLVEDPKNYAVKIQLPEDRVKYLKSQAFIQSMETIRNRVDEFGVKEPIIQRQGLTGDRILIQLPGEKDIARAKQIIGKTAFLEFRLVKDGPKSKDALLAPYNGKVPKGYELVPAAEKRQGERLYYLLEKEAQVTGADLETARIGRDRYGLPAVDFRLNRQGAKKFAKLTGANIGKRLAIVLDGKVQSAPTIQSRIYAEGQITGQFTIEEARDLAIILRAGALPVPVYYLEERTVGPSLGVDSIRRGLRAGILGLVLVLIFMVIYYKGAGLIADFGVLLDMILIGGALAGFNATLTLPGIAGIILTIGMAVDANVLIFERIREELRMGKTLRVAVSRGFSKAFITILDANLTTFIAALVLLNFGSGPVRGFAVTLSLGIIASMFTALFVARFIFDVILLNPKRTKISI